MKKSLLLLASLAVVGFGCSKPAVETVTPAVFPDVLAEIGSSVVTKKDFALEIERRGRRPATEAERTEWLQEMVRRETLFANARLAGWDQDPEIQLAFKKMVVGKYLERHHPKSTAPSAEEIEGCYRDHSEDFVRPASSRFSVIYLNLSAKATPEKRGAMLQKVEGLRRDLLARNAGHDEFGAMAEQVSEDNGTRFRRGDAGLLVSGISPGRWPSEVVEAVFAMKTPGEISGVVGAEDGFYILRLVEKEERSVRPFAEVQPVIQRRLADMAARRAEEAFYAEESTRAGTIIHSNAVETISLTPQSVAQISNPPSIPR